MQFSLIEVQKAINFWVGGEKVFQTFNFSSRLLRVQTLMIGQGDMTNWVVEVENINNDEEFGERDD